MLESRQAKHSLVQTPILLAAKYSNGNSKNIFLINYSMYSHWLGGEQALHTDTIVACNFRVNGKRTETKENWNRTTIYLFCKLLG